MNEQQETMIIVKDLYKSFRLPHEQHNGIKQKLIHIVRPVKKRQGRHEMHHALKDISFEINKGEFFGIVGRNGSGKSTLLKLLAGIYTADKGAIAVNGSLTPFIELGVGFNPELTGRENVYLNGALLGFSRQEMDRMYDDIVAFAELERFMDQKLKNYSSGMQVRLAFSIAIRAESDILLIDEVLAVGDAAFQKKCYNYFMKLKDSHRTVILVTHDMSAVKDYCTRAVLIDGGRIKVIGKPEEIANQYTIDNFDSNQLKVTSHQELNNGIKQLDVRLKKPAFDESDNLEFEVLYELENELPIDLGISIKARSVSLIEKNTKDINLDYSPHKKHSVSYRMPIGMLNSGEYYVDVAAFDAETSALLAFTVDAAHFLITSKGEKQFGIVRHKGKWGDSK